MCTKIFAGYPASSRRDQAELSQSDADQRVARAIGLRALSSAGTINFGDAEAILLPPWANPDQHLQPRDVLVAVRGTIMKAAILETVSKSLYATSNLAVLRPDEKKVSPEYLWAYLENARSNLQTVFKRSTTGQLSVTLKELGSLQIPELSLEKQQSIGKAAIALRDSLTSQERVLIQSREVLKAFLHEQFTEAYNA